MSKKITIYSYNKVWKVKKKIYSIQNFVLPVPIDPFQILYFSCAFIFIVILGNILPFIKLIPTVIRCIAIPYGITTFLMKKKLDGKNPIKFFIGLMVYVFVERNSYYERFKRGIRKRNSNMKLNWNCSRGRLLLNGMEMEVINSVESLSDENEDYDITFSETQILELNDELNLDQEEITEIIQNKLSEENGLDDSYETEQVIQEEGIAVSEPEKKDRTSIFKNVKVSRPIKRKKSQKISFKRENGNTIQNLTDKYITRPMKEVKERLKDSKPKQKRVVELKKKSQDITVFRKNDIAIPISLVSLVEGGGCSHLSEVILRYIKIKTNENICIISNSNFDEDINRYSYSNQNYDLYSEYKYIIYDFGNMDKLDSQQLNELWRSEIKIMVSSINDNFIDKLEEFIEKEEKSHKGVKWKFLFNLVPENKIEKVDELMEDYEYYCLPSLDKKDIDKNTMKIFDRIFTGKES